MLGGCLVCLLLLAMLSNVIKEFCALLLAFACYIAKYY
jgi:hypothetical protein